MTRMNNAILQSVFYVRIFFYVKYMILCLSLTWCMVFNMPHMMQVPGNLVISARSPSHSFDFSQMNMSHVISHFSFGKKINPRERSDVKRLLPYLFRSYDRLSGLSYISNPSDSNENVTVSSSAFFTDI